MSRLLRHKFKAVPTTHDGIRFSSKKEANRYLELKELQRQGYVRCFWLQTPILLPGPTKYVDDFTVFWADDTVTIEDVKGFRTPQYTLKKKQVEALYPFKITEI
jgi:hypothetical protein